MKQRVLELYCRGTRSVAFKTFLVRVTIHSNVHSISASSHE